MLQDLDKDFNSETAQAGSFNQEFITEYIHNQRIKVQTRKNLEEFLFFLACQVVSASLALVLFQYALSFWMTVWLCQLIAWLPSLTSLGELSFEKTTDGWQIKIMKRPITTIIKFITSVGLVSVSIWTVHSELEQTDQAIRETYKIIKQYENPNPVDFLPPQAGTYILSSIAIVGTLFLLKGLRNRTPFD
ncbi:MAG: hypothetical protein F6K58_21795 [Symploca sp. SIO2E9]|nr:hypothetical protein [Symploca sp. SIO2E9]